VILSCFIGFIVLYFIWDFNEYRTSKKISPKERCLYGAMSLWECISFGILISLVLYLIIYPENYVGLQKWMTIFIVIITGVFVLLVSEKWDIYKTKKAEFTLEEKNTIMQNLNKSN